MIQLASDLILITAGITSTSLALLGVLPLDTSWSASTEWRLEAEVNVLLGVQPHYERGRVDNLRFYSDVSLLDQDMLKEVFNLQTQHVVMLPLGLVQTINLENGEGIVGGEIALGCLGGLHLVRSLAL